MALYLWKVFRFIYIIVSQLYSLRICQVHETEYILYQLTTEWALDRNRWHGVLQPSIVIEFFTAEKGSDKCHSGLLICLKNLYAFVWCVCWGWEVGDDWVCLFVYVCVCVCTTVCVCECVCHTVCVWVCVSHSVCVWCWSVPFEQHRQGST